VMGNRSDRRLANLTNSKALEAVGPMRTSRADFHQGPERHNQLHTEAGYTTATGSPFTSTDDLALGAGSIVRWEKLSMTDGCKSRPARAVAGRAGTESCGRRGDAGSEA